MSVIIQHPVCYWEYSSIYQRICAILCSFVHIIVSRYMMDNTYCASLHKILIFVGHALCIPWNTLIMVQMRNHIIEQFYIQYELMGLSFQYLHRKTNTDGIKWYSIQFLSNLDRKYYTINSAMVYVLLENCQIRRPSFPKHHLQWLLCRAICLTHRCRDKVAAISQTTFLNAFLE